MPTYLLKYVFVCYTDILHTYIDTYIYALSTAEMKRRFTVLCTALSREFVLPQIPVDEVYIVHSILIFIFYFFKAVC